MKTVRYVVIVEKGEDGFCVYVPDLPGCVTVGDTREEALRLIEEAVEPHLEASREDGLPIPEPSSSSEYVEVGAAQMEQRSRRTCPNRSPARRSYADA